MTQQNTQYTPENNGNRVRGGVTQEVAELGYFRLTMAQAAAEGVMSVRHLNEAAKLAQAEREANLLAAENDDVVLTYPEKFAADRTQQSDLAHARATISQLQNGEGMPL